MKELFIERVKEGKDIGLLSAFATATFTNTYKHLIPQETIKTYTSKAFEESRLSALIKSGASVCYIARSNDDICGYCKINIAPFQSAVNEPLGIEVEKLYINEGAKGKGLGAALLQKAIEEGLSRAMQFIWLAVWEKNEHAIAFYTKKGFSKFGVLPFPMGEEVFQDLLMKRPLIFEP